MNILGLSCFYHDSAAALLVDGKVTAAAAEERFSRNKHDNDFPLIASEFCLATSGKTVYDLDYIAFYDKPILKFERVIFTHFKYFPHSISAFLSFLPGWINKNLSISFHIRTNLSTECPIYFIGHHASHAASAFYPSPFDEALILTADGVGEWATASWGTGRENKISLKQEIHFPHSLGLLYSAFTAYLGFRPNGGEGKVMALASYGEPRFSKEFSKLIHVFEDGSFKMDPVYFGYMTGTRMYSQKLIDLLGPPREPESELEQRHFDIAATLQATLETVLIKMVRYLVSETSIKKLCLAGGVALNCVANGKLLDQSGLEDIYIQPAAGDDGAALGAALFLHHQILENNGRTPIENYYLGPKYSAAYIRAMLNRKDTGITWTEMDEEALVSKTAESILDDKIIGWFQNRMEFGPRALGNRSILANPSNPDMKDIVNTKVKMRETFRPFAPAVLAEHADRYFDLKCPSPFMLFASPLKADKAGEVPAVNHVDNTARVQTVEVENNPKFHRLLSELNEISGVPMVLNTSFNLRGEPMVCTPADALDCFLRSEIDILVLDNFWIEKKPIPR